MKILFLVPYPTEGASNRVRVEQYLPYLDSEGIAYTVRPFINARFYRILYFPHKYLEKIFWFIVCTINRIFDILRSLRYDVIFVHREIYPFGAPVFETIISRMGKTLIFDFDDAIFLPNTSRENIYIERFKKPGKIEKIIGMCKEIIVGNDYLRDFALNHNKNVTVIPSSVDTTIYKPVPKNENGGNIVIGWIGSNTTKEYLYDIKDAIAALSNKYKNIIFKIVGAEFKGLRSNNILNKKWSLQGELSDLQGFDIGIMPLPENEWAKGKCGFKLLLYMSCAIPVVTSPVGMNREIIRNGYNGFFATTEAEWIEILSRLIEDAGLRRRVGLAGRETVERNYSLDRTAPRFIKVLRKV